MAASSETAETDSVKNAKTAVAIFVREKDNYVTLKTDIHGLYVIMDDKQIVVNPLRNLNDPALWPEKGKYFYIVYTAAYWVNKKLLCK